MPEFEIDITVTDDRWHSDIEDIEAKSRDIIRHVLNDRIPMIEVIEISLVFGNDDFVQNLNKTYRQQDKATNVLSFPQTESGELESNHPFVSLGDIIIAYETIKAESLSQDKHVVDHFTHILIHGCLHLLHYDHQDDKEAEEMENLEIHYLQDMGIKNPYERQ